MPPLRFNDSAPIIQAHFLVNYLGQQAFPIVGANGDKIGPFLAIIIIFEPQGASALRFSVPGGGDFFLDIINQKT